MRELSQDRRLWKWGNQWFQIYYVGHGRDQNHGCIWKIRKLRLWERDLTPRSQHRAFQRHRLHSAQLGELTLNASQGSLEKQTPQVPMWESRLLLERGPRQSLSSGGHMEQGVLPEEKRVWYKAARGPDGILENQKLPPHFHRCSNMELHLRCSQVRPGDLEGHYLQVSGAQFGHQRIVSSLEMWDSDKFHSLKCRPKYSFPVLTNKFKLD